MHDWECHVEESMSGASKQDFKKPMLGFEEQVGCHQVWKGQKVSRKAKKKKSPLSPVHPPSIFTYDLTFIFQCSDEMLV